MLLQHGDLLLTTIMNLHWQRDCTICARNPNDLRDVKAINVSQKAHFLKNSLQEL